METLPTVTPHCSPTLEKKEIASLYNWVEITNDFKTSAESLEPGELIKDYGFSLYEAMSAIELMDPKMDSWMVSKQVKREIYTFKERIEQKSIKLDNFSPEELIVLMDHSHACFLSWLDGQSLAQSLFTCLYLHNPNEIKNKCLQTWSYAMLKLCRLVKDIIIMAHVVEDEDFQMNHFGFNLFDDLKVSKIVSNLREVEDDYGRLIRATKSKQESQNVENVKNTIEEYEGVQRRIKFTRNLLQVIENFATSKQQNKPSIPIEKTLQQMTENLKFMKKTSKLDVNTITNPFDTELAIPSFEPLINQSILPATFPRYATIISIKESFQVYEDLIKKFLHLVSISKNNSIQFLLNFLKEFSRGRTCVLSRSVAQLLFLPLVDDSFSLDAIRDCMRTHNAPPTLSTILPRSMSSQAQMKIPVENFLSQALVTVIKLFQVYGFNSARQREKLSLVLECLSELQEYGDSCDSNLTDFIRRCDHEIINHQPASSTITHMAYFGGWSLYYTLNVMIAYVNSGFLLDLYSNHELHYVYWYLAETLLYWKIQQLGRANNQLNWEKDLVEKLEISNKNGRSRKNTKKAKKKTTVIKTHITESICTKVWSALCWGMHKCLLAFALQGKFLPPQYQFDNEEIRYEHRFSPFQSITTPPYYPYKEYINYTNKLSDRNPHQLLMSSSQYFDQAKAMLSDEEFLEKESLLKVAKTNFIVTKILSDPKNSANEKKISLDFTTHKTFPIIKIS